MQKPIRVKWETEQGAGLTATYKGHPLRMTFNDDTKLYIGWIDGKQTCSAETKSELYRKMADELHEADANKPQREMPRRKYKNLHPRARAIKTLRDWSLRQLAPPTTRQVRERIAKNWPHMQPGDREDILNNYAGGKVPKPVERPAVQAAE